MEIRLANEDHAEGMATVHVQSWQTAYRNIIPDNFLDTMSIDRREQFWRARLENAFPGQAWVAIEDREVCGFVDAGLSRDPGASAVTGELYAIYISPYHARKGFGTRLIQTAERWMQDAGYAVATLWVLAENLSGRSFYEARGWHPDGAVKSELIGGVPLDTVRYRKTMSSACLE